MKDIHLQYKSETGRTEKVYMAEHLDPDDFEDAEMYDPDYVEWLEEKVEELQKETVKRLY